MDLAFRKQYLQNPEEAIANLSATLQQYGVNLTEETNDITAKVKKAYTSTIEAGGSVEEATTALYTESMRLEKEARSQVGDGLRYSTDEDGGARKRGAGASQ